VNYTDIDYEGLCPCFSAPKGSVLPGGAPDVYPHDVNYTDIDYEGLCPCFSAPYG
jgi:hypothetical protein